MIPAQQPTDDLPGLLKLLEEEEVKRRRKSDAIKQVVYGLTGGYAVIALVVFLIKREFDFSSVASFTGLFACVAAGVGVSAQHKEALDRASLWQDTRLIPHLLEALDADKEEIKSEARGALRHLLPLLEQENSCQITLSSHQRTMLENLCKAEDLPLACAAIRSLPKLGDSGTLKALDSLGALTKGERKPNEAKTAALAMSAAGDLRLRLAREQIEAETERIESTTQRETL